MMENVVLPLINKQNRTTKMSYLFIFLIKEVINVTVFGRTKLTLCP